MNGRLNYKQLHYFWRVAKSGSIARAAEHLRLAPQTISAQVATLEDALGTELFRRAGRRLELTAAGELALSYAEDIFQIGRELEEVLRNRPGGGDLQFRVGIADVVPKSIAYRLLAPAMSLSVNVRIVCREDKLERLFAELSIHKLDLVIADCPLPPGLGVKAYSHALGGAPIAFFAAAQLAHRLAAAFPRSLNGAPLLMPGDGATMQRSLVRWFSEQQITPQIVGEFDDAALMQAFGKAGAGAFPAPAILADEMLSQYEAELVGVVQDVAAKYYAISVDRKLTHPAVLAVSEGARTGLLADPASGREALPIK